MVGRVHPAAVMSALLAGACASGPDAAPGADSVVASTTESSAVAPAATPIAEWRMTEQGLGPLHAGMSYQEASAVLPGTFSPPTGADGESCVHAVWDSAPPGIRVMVVDGRVGRVEVVGGTTATAAGVRIGDAEPRVDSLYPGRVRRMPHKYTGGRYLIVVARPPLDTLARLVFETDGATVTSYRAGRFPPVEYVEGCG